MIKRCDPYNCNTPRLMTERDKENLEIMKWAWNSHFWVESYPGYTTCKWCGRQHTSEMEVNLDYPLCPENPCIMKFLEERQNG